MDYNTLSDAFAVLALISGGALIGVVINNHLAHADFILFTVTITLIFALCICWVLAEQQRDERC